MEAYLDCLFLLVLALADYVFKGIAPCQVGYQICGHRVVHDISLLSF